MIRDNILISSYCKILLLIILSCSLYACGKTVDVVSESSVVEEDEKVDSDIELTHKALFERSKRGIDFIIVDNRKNYLLELDFDDKFLLTDLTDNSTGQYPATIAEIAKDPSLMRFISEEEKNLLIIQLHKTECILPSGERMNFSVAVDFTQQSTEDLKVFYGCGDYVPDFNLHGRWQIIEFASEKLRRDNFVNNFPYFKIDMIKKYLVGSDGCNHVSADIDVQYKTISFGLFLSTKMVCGNLQQGPQMISFLESQKFNYSFDDENRINLLKDGEVVMVLQSING